MKSNSKMNTCLIGLIGIKRSKILILALLVPFSLMAGPIDRKAIIARHNFQTSDMSQIETGRQMGEMKQASVKPEVSDNHHSN